MECLICQENASDAVACPHCRGLFCRSHLMVWVRKKGNCPHCRQQLTVQRVCYLPACRAETAKVDQFLPYVLTHLLCLAVSQSFAVSLHERIT